MPLQVDQLRMAVCALFQISQLADFLNGAVFNGHRFGARALGIHGNDVTAVEDGVRRIAVGNGTERKAGEKAGKRPGNQSLFHSSPALMRQRITAWAY